jgi:hypothetical protein
MKHQSATAHELARIAELAGLPGETLARLGEQMERRELGPGETLLRPSDTFTTSVTALTPATVASCDRAVYESLLA